MHKFVEKNLFAFRHCSQLASGRPSLVGRVYQQGSKIAYKETQQDYIITDLSLIAGNVYIVTEIYVPKVMFALIVAHISKEKSRNSCLGKLKSSRKCLPRTCPQVAMGRSLVDGKYQT